MAWTSPELKAVSVIKAALMPYATLHESEAKITKRAVQIVENLKEQGIKLEMK